MRKGCWMRTALYIATTLAAAVMSLAGCGNREEVLRAADPASRPQREAASSAEETRPLKAGDRLPAVEVTDVEGRALDLSRVVAAKPAVIIFYRGGWCPYCNRHLGALGTIEPRLVKLGYQVLAISADRPAKVLVTREKFGFHYRLLSDSTMEAARAFGIAFKVDDGTLQKYQGYGIDLEAASGETHHLLPVPSVFIGGTDGVIRYAYSNPDYKVRVSPKEVLAAAERAAE